KNTRLSSPAWRSTAAYWLRNDGARAVRRRDQRVSSAQPFHRTRALTVAQVNAPGAGGPHRGASPLRLFPSARAQRAADPAIWPRRDGGRAPCASPLAWGVGYRLPEAREGPGDHGALGSASPAGIAGRFRP